MASKQKKTPFQEAQDKANAANELRYQQMMQIYDSVIAQYQPGGSFGKGAEALYEQGKSKAMATGVQSLVDSGLSNTTVAAGLPIKYEEEVGSPFRLQLEDMRMSRLSEAQVGKAGAIERRTDQAPDPSLYASLASGAANQTTGGASFSDVNTNSFVEKNRGTGGSSPYGTSGGMTYGKSTGKSVPTTFDKGYDYTQPTVFNAKTEYNNLMTGSSYTPGKTSLSQLGSAFQAGVSPTSVFSYKPTESQLTDYFKPAPKSTTGAAQAWGF